MRTISVSHARTHVSAVLRSLAETAEAVLITKKGRAMAQLSPLTETEKSAIELAPRLRAAKGASDA